MLVAIPLQEPLPKIYNELSAEELDERIWYAKRVLGERLVILGHHYQRDEVIKFADFRGDSYKLSQLAASRTQAEYIVFCGVHFMAESADILSGPHQKVILPDLNAGCSMADMADIDQVEECWELLNEALDEPIVPITYMNSAANLKAFVGRNGGAVCTSSNAPAALRWALDRGSKVLFFPDQHLGRNTATLKLGYRLDDCIVWDPFKDWGGHDPEDYREKKFILWKGHCSVHGMFTVEMIHKWRREVPDINILVHPECRYELVSIADYDGSTEYIVKTVSAAPPGSKWAIGTEINLVHRLAKENPDKFVRCLNENVCVCATMYRIDQQHLCWALENLLEGNVVNQITVPEDIAHWARVALDRMLQIH
ncbi:MAG: quinolinate synthase NadA [Abditibacteriales bacterium]|nr:quinolinate synthase NadA [Abditibacteriales bacterium]MDW8364606.1 quinolinate synthase NadA [Abditibacteriales bacterium]